VSKNSSAHWSEGINEKYVFPIMFCCSMHSIDDGIYCFVIVIVIVIVIVYVILHNPHYVLAIACFFSHCHWCGCHQKHLVPKFLCSSWCMLGSKNRAHLSEVGPMRKEVFELFLFNV
jgi:hypothetical protein